MLSIKKLLQNIFILISSSFFLISCEENTSQLEQSQVAFDQDTLKIFTDSLYNPEINILIDPPAAMQSTITLQVESQRDNFFSTDPPIRFGNLTLPVAVNDAMISFQFNPITDNLGGEDANVEFEIIALGQGLNAQPLEGRFFTIQIVTNKAPNFMAPYQEDFTACLTGSFPPEGWKEVEIAQNNENSAHWGCIASPQSGVAINAFVTGSSDDSNSEVWLVSPIINLINLSKPTLRFSVDRRFSPSDPGLEPYDFLISIDYEGENFASATWERFFAACAAIEANDPDTDGFSDSGALDLSAYAGESLTFAFVYRAGAPGTSNATIMRIANFSVQ